tara:strand:+ start:136 stop:552 length:417 start_codon:yes stop_codon:yes gene_type:complete
MILFEYIDVNKLDLQKKDVVVWLKSVLVREDPTKKLGDITYVFCNDDFLKEKNKLFLNHDYLTDVITFDYSKESTVSADILISIDRVLVNSKKYDVDFLCELKRVMIHGLLHLLGYNDNSDEEKKEMRKKENFYITLF